MRTQQEDGYRQTPTRHSRFWMTALVMLCLAHSAGAGTPINETRPAAVDARVEVANVSGDITLTGWERAELRVTGTLGRDAKELRIEGDSRRWKVQVILPKHIRLNAEETRLQIQVPRGSTIEVDAVSSNLEVHGVDGRVELETLSGDIDLSGTPKAVRASTASGDIRLDSQCPDVTVESMNGDVTIKGGSGMAVVEAVSGDIDLGASRYDRLEVNCVSGDVAFSGVLLNGGSYAFTCHSGDIILRLPANTGATFDASTFSGDIENGLGPAAERASEYAPGMELDFEIGDGSASVRAESFSGNIRLIAQ